MKLSSHKANRSTKIELSMSSMIDVVFLLLIFFMVTTTFRKTERELDPAVKSQQRSSNTSESDFEPVIVEVVAADGRTFYRLGTAVFASDAELVSTLRQFDRTEDGAYVKVSDAAQFGFAAGAMQACKAAGFSAVSYIPWDGA